VNQRVNQYLYQVVGNLVQRGKLAAQPRDYSIYREKSPVGSFRFCLIRKVVTPESDVSPANARVLGTKYAIRRLCGSAAQWYGLENSAIILENVPLFSKTKREHTLDYIDPEDMRALRTSSRRSRKPLPSTDATAASQGAGSAIPEADEDVFSARMASEREANKEMIGKSVIGGNTASFRALQPDEDPIDEDSFSDDD
jgi:KUP system potassium uptake protein